MLPARVLGVSSISFLGRTWVDLKQSDPKLTEFIEYYTRFWGIQGILLAVMLTFITFTAYKKNEKWAWVAVLICASIGWASAMILDIKLGLSSILWIEIVPLGFAYASLLASMRDVFSRTSRDQIER